MKLQGNVYKLSIHNLFKHNNYIKISFNHQNSIPTYQPFIYHGSLMAIISLKVYRRWIQSVKFKKNPPAHQHELVGA